MAFDPWNIPHDCEKEDVAGRLVRLSPSQRKVLRSYVRNVEFGDNTLAEWIERDDVPRVALSTWRKPFDKGGNYWGTEDSPNIFFRDTVTAYVTANSRWQTGEEEKSIHDANRMIRLGARLAAKKIMNLVVKADRDSVSLNAAKTVLDRASVETAEKGSMALGVSIEAFAEMKEKAEAEADELEDEALDEWEA